MTKGLPRSLSRNKSGGGASLKTIRVSNVAIAVVGASGIGFGGAVIGDFPEGNIMFRGAVAYMTFSSPTGDTDISATYDGDFGIGTTPNADTSLATTEVNLISSTPLGAATARTSPTVRGTGITAAIFDNTDGSLEINLNLLIDDADISGTADLVANGVLYLDYEVLGDD